MIASLLLFMLSLSNKHYKLIKDTNPYLSHHKWAHQNLHDTHPNKKTILFAHASKMS